MTTKSNSQPIADPVDKVESLQTFNQTKQKFQTMANQIKGKIEETKSDFKITMLENFNNF